MNRLVDPEILDGLSEMAPEAQHSRRDLQLLNRIMGHARLVARNLAGKTFAEIGGGDGTLALEIARLSKIRDAKFKLLDQLSLLNETTRNEFQKLGWKVEAVKADILDCNIAPVDCMFANLFLHHFSDDQLRSLFVKLESNCSLFIACEPRRSNFAMLAARSIGLLGCNHVTRHDARVSVRAGFSGNDLTALWPGGRNWEITEKLAGSFSHLFVASKCAR